MTTPPSASTPAAIAASKWRLPPVRGMVTLVAGEGASRVLSFLAVALLTRRLGAATWAPIAVALTVTQFGTLLVEMGMRLLGAREVAREGERAQTMIPTVVATQVVVAFGLVAVAVVTYGARLVAVDLGRLLPGYALSLVALPFFVPWVFQGFGAMGWVAGPQVTRYALFLALTALLVTSSARVSWLPWLEAGAAGGGALVAVFALRSFGLRISFRNARVFERGLIREALPIAASQVLWVVRMYLPTLVLWFVAARASVGTFDVAHRVLMVLQALLTMYLTNLYTPLSRHGREPRAFVGLLLGSTAFAAAVAVLGAAAISLRASSVLTVLYGGAFNTAEGVTNLTILAFVVPVLTVRGHAHYALVALGHQRRELACSVASSVVLVVLLLLWVATGGGRAAALSMLIAESLGLLVTWGVLAVTLRRHDAAPAQAAGQAWLS